MYLGIFVLLTGFHHVGLVLLASDCTLRAPTAAHISSDGEEKRHQVMQNLFGNQCEEEEEEVNSDDESNPQPKSYRAITRLSIVLLHALRSAETSTGLIKEGYTILLKHFRTITTKCCN
ncbi:uncharacterized protein [Pyrus communis]|uniref:uncharacterized protein isoform X1 n=1 Tax=Pyrus communis TaxID=23211 RepID=UPI0035C206C0